MNVLGRYEVQRRRGDVGGTYLVGIQGEQAFTITARCHNQRDAELVASALNNQGAVRERDEFRQAVIDALDADLISDGARINRIRARLGLPTTRGQ